MIERFGRDRAPRDETRRSPDARRSLRPVARIGTPGTAETSARQFWPEYRRVLARRGNHEGESTSSSRASAGARSVVWEAEIQNE